MTTRLVNVRLDAEQLRKARLLRAHGIVLSELVRAAIDERFEALRLARRTRDVASIVDEIFQKYPDPPDLPPREYDVHDRRAAADAVRAKLRRAR